MGGYGYFLEQALIFLAEHGELRGLRFSEGLYREGEKQNQDWSGTLSAQG